MEKFWKKSTLFKYILILAIGLRLPLLGGSFWMDEAAQALESARPWYLQLQIAQDFQPPLIHLLLFIPIRISQAEWWLRTIGALIPGLITIWGTYYLGKKLVSQKVGAIAALLLATSSFHIFYSQELRPYSLPAMWAILSWIYLFQTTRLKKSHFSNWIGFIVTTILGLYSSYLYPFLLLSQLSWIAWQKKSHLEWGIGSALLSGLAFLPWLPSFLEQLAVGGTVRERLPGWERVVSLTQLKSPPLVLGKFLFGVINIELNTFFIASTLVFFLLLAWLSLKNSHLIKQKKHQQKIKLLLSWLVLPFLAAWIVSFWVPIIRPKRLLMLMPAFYLLIGWIATAGRKKLLRQIGLVLLGLVFSLNLSGVLQYHLNPHYQRENWRALHQQVLTKYQPEETIALFSFPDAFSPWIWYDQANYPILTTGELYVESIDNLSLTLKELREYRYVLLFDYLRDLTDPNDKLRNELWALGFHEVDALDYPNIGFVRVFSRENHTAQL